MSFDTDVVDIQEHDAQLDAKETTLSISDPKTTFSSALRLSRGVVTQPRARYSRTHRHAGTHAPNRKLCQRTWIHKILYTYTHTFTHTNRYTHTHIVSISVSNETKRKFVKTQLQRQSWTIKRNTSVWSNQYINSLIRHLVKRAGQRCVCSVWMRSSDWIFFLFFFKCYYLLDFFVGFWINLNVNWKIDIQTRVEKIWRERERKTHSAGFGIETLFGRVK